MRQRAGLLTALALPAVLVAGCQVPTRSTAAFASARPNTPASTVRGLAVANDNARRISNGRLAFQLEAPAGDHTQTDVYTVKPNGSDLTALTTTPNENEFGPAWNATGTRIAFWRTPAPFGPGSIWTMDADGGGQQRLTTGLDARDPVWNPAGTRLAFTLVDATGFHIWSMPRTVAISGRSRRARPRTSSPPGRRMAPRLPLPAASNRATRVTSPSSTSPPVR